MPQGLVQPANNILYAGDPVYLEKEVLTNANTGDAVVMMTAVSGASIAVGTKVQAATGGKVIQSTDATKAVGYSLQVKAGAVDAWILVKLTLV